MPRYQMTVAADSLGELIGQLVEMAALLEFSGSQLAMSAELAPLAELPEPAHLQGIPLPVPPPDYEATGLTNHQQMQVRQYQSQPAVAVVPAPVMATSPATPDGIPVCPIHQRPMTWKGGAISQKSGKSLPLWSCPDTNCRQAIWP